MGAIASFCKLGSLCVSFFSPSVERRDDNFESCAEEGSRKVEKETLLCFLPCRGMHSDHYIIYNESDRLKCYLVFIVLHVVT